MPRRRNVVPESVTGRDGYIVAQALLYAIACIQNLPEEKQEWSNMRDMCRILRASDNPFLCMLSGGVEHHTGWLPNLWPEPDEELRPEDCAQRDEFNAAVFALKEMQARALADFLAANPEFATSSEGVLAETREDA